VHRLWPHLVLFAGADKFGNDQLVAVSSDVVHQTPGLVFAVQDSQIGVDAVVSAFKRHALLEQSD